MVKRRDNYNSMTWDIDWFDEQWLEADLSQRDNAILNLQNDVTSINTSIWNIQTDISNIQFNISDIFNKFTTWYTWTVIISWTTLVFNEWLLTSVI